MYIIYVSYMCVKYEYDKVYIYVSYTLFLKYIYIYRERERESYPQVNIEYGVNIHHLPNGFFFEKSPRMFDSSEPVALAGVE